MRTMAKRLVWPILTLFLIRNNLTTIEIGIIFSTATVLGLILEIPSGAIADKIGRKNSLVIANLGWALSMFIFYIYSSFWGFFIANSIYWMAGSLFSGTHEAIIYETLKELKQEKILKKVVGKALFISQISTGVLFIVVPIIANYSMHLPFLINTIVFVVGAVLVATMREPKRTVDVSEKEIGSKKDLFGIREFSSNHILLIVAITFSLLGGINGLLEDFRQAYLDFIHLDMAYFGFIYLALRLVTGVVGNNVENIEKKIGKVATFWLMPLVSLFTYIGLFMINSLWGLLFITLDGIGEGISRPLEQDYLNSAIKGSKRATFISLFNFMNNIVRAIVVFFGAIVMDHYGINSGFAFLAILTVVFVFPMGYVMNKKIKAKLI